MLTVEDFPDLQAVPSDGVISQLIAHPVVFHVRHWNDGERLHVVVEGTTHGRYYVLHFVQRLDQGGWSLERVEPWYENP